MKKSIHSGIAGMLLVAMLSMSGIGCATRGQKVTVVENQKDGSTTVIRENENEIKSTKFNKPQFSEPEIQVAPDSKLK